MKTIAFFVILFTASQQAEAQIPFEDKLTRVTLISDVSSVSPGSEFRAGVYFQMEPGWHIYWKNPGSSGLATKIEWKLPENISAEILQWPFPERTLTSGLATYGYSDHLLLMARFRVSKNASPGDEINLEAQASWLACQENCVPGKRSLKLSIPVNEAEPAANPSTGGIFSQAAARLPLQESPWQISGSKSWGHIILRLGPPSDYMGRLEDIYFFPETLNLIKYEAPQKLKKDGRTYFLKIPESSAGSGRSARLVGVLFSKSGWNGSKQAQALAVDVPLKK